MRKKHSWKSGDVYGRLMLTGKSYRDEKSKQYVEAICSCGKIKWYRFDAVYSSVSADISCGCANTERLQRDKIRTTHGLIKHPLYRVYRSMIDRCYVKSNNRYPSYGEKGVIVCEEWNGKFPTFYEWAIGKWEKGLQLDKDTLYREKFGTHTGMVYSPEFCCFITPKQNSNRRSSSTYLEYNGRTQTMAEWSDELGISQSTISNRIHSLGWSIEKALSTPLNYNAKKYYKTVIEKARN